MLFNIFTTIPCCPTTAKPQEKQNKENRQDYKKKLV